MGMGDNTVLSRPGGGAFEFHPVHAIFNLFYHPEVRCIPGSFG